jgi:Family of unknown function (DUF6157)
VHSTNYVDTFIALAPDSRATRGVEPPARATPSIAQRLFRMIADHPYRYTSDDVVFGVYADRQALPRSERAAARKAFFSRGQPCLRACDLGKKYGWGIHHDGAGKIALYGVESAAYREFVEGERRTATGQAIAITRAMRSSR